MASIAHLVRLGVLSACGICVAAGTALAAPTGLSNFIVLNPQTYEPWAVYAYDPNQGVWNQLGNVSWQSTPTSLTHVGYVIQATADQPTAVSTYRVVIQVTGVSIELFITPTAMQELTAGETTTLRINNVL